jgi:hypothetical protein
MRSTIRIRASLISWRYFRCTLPGWGTGSVKLVMQVAPHSQMISLGIVSGMMVVGNGLFLAFDRYSVDRPATGAITRDELLSSVRGDELHKLMGTTQAILIPLLHFLPMNLSI